MIESTEVRFRMGDVVAHAFTPQVRYARVVGFRKNVETARSILVREFVAGDVAWPSGEYAYTSGLSITHHQPGEVAP